MVCCADSVHLICCFIQALFELSVQASVFFNLTQNWLAECIAASWRPVLTSSEPFYSGPQPFCSTPKPFCSNPQPGRHQLRSNNPQHRNSQPQHHVKLPVHFCHRLLSMDLHLTLNNMSKLHDEQQPHMSNHNQHQEAAHLQRRLMRTGKTLRGHQLQLHTLISQLICRAVAAVVGAAVGAAVGLLIMQHMPVISLYRQKQHLHLGGSTICP